MRWLPNAVVAHLRSVIDEPDLEGTRYRLEGRIGRGGMAIVYAAEDTELGRRVALKVARGGAAFAERLQREARVLARLEHPGIVPLHDVGVLAGGEVYYAMKLVKGVTLATWLADARPELPAALRIFHRVCEAVAFAHASGVVHRDLKPDNVMIGEFGEALVMDWGIASALTEGAGEGAPRASDATRDGAVIGTPAYMAPEQARGEIATLDARTDVYGLGATLYAVLARRSPFFEHDGTGAILAAVRAGGPTPVRVVAPSIQPPLASICAKAMASAPADRYASAQELAEDIARYLDGGRVRAHAETFVERVQRIAARHRVVLTLLVVYLVVRVLMAFAFR